MWVAFDAARGSATIEATHLLPATGWRPNTDDPDVDQVGIAPDARGYIQVDDTLRTSVRRIWALSDCNGHDAFTHIAYDDV